MRDLFQALRAPSITSSASGRAVLCMLGGSLLLTLNDTVMKWLSADYPIGQILFMRGLFVSLPIAWLVWRAGGITVLRVRNLGGQALRAGLVVFSTFMFVTGLSLMPMADTFAIAFAGPLFLTALAVLLLGEQVGWRRWCAVAVGFGGVLLILRPTGDALRWVALMPLAAAFAGALRDIVTRRISNTESSTAILCLTSLAVTLAGLATLPFGWQPVQAGDVLWLALAGLLVGGAHYFLIETFRLAEAALVAPFKYSSMIWAILLGFVVWGDLPDAWTVAGSALIIGSGLYILHREIRHHPPRATPLVSEPVDSV